MQKTNARDICPASEKIPAVVQLGPFSYEVKIEDASMPDDDNYHQFGEIDYRRREIRVTRFRCRQESQEESFCHEVMHGLFDLAKIERDEKLCENTVCRLGVALYQLLKNNRLYFGEED